MIMARVDYVTVKRRLLPRLPGRRLDSVCVLFLLDIVTLHFTKNQGIATLVAEYFYLVRL
jgi:hypothetical protein